MQPMGVSEVVAIATGLLVACAGVIARLYRDRNAERARADALQEQLHRDHKRDLRHVAGLPTSLQPQPPSAPTFQSSQLFNIRDVRAEVDEDPPSTQRPPPRKPPRPR